MEHVTQDGKISRSQDQRQLRIPTNCIEVLRLGRVEAGRPDQKRDVAADVADHL